MRDAHGNARAFCALANEPAPLIQMRVQDAVFRMSAAKTRKTAGDPESLPDAQRILVIDLAAEGNDLFIKLSRLFAAGIKVELHLTAIEHAIEIHEPAFQTRAIHLRDDLQDANSLFFHRFS